MMMQPHGIAMLPVRSHDANNVWMCRSTILKRKRLLRPHTAPGRTASRRPLPPPRQALRAAALPDTFLDQGAQAYLLQHWVPPPPPQTCAMRQHLQQRMTTQPPQMRMDPWQVAASCGLKATTARAAA